MPHYSQNLEWGQKEKPDQRRTPKSNMVDFCVKSDSFNKKHFIKTFISLHLSNQVAHSVLSNHF